MHLRGRCRCRRRGIAFLFALQLAVLGPSSAAEDELASRAALAERLVERVRTSPDDAASWRMLGHLALEYDRIEEAAAFLSRSVEINDLSAAAWFDLARAHEGLEQSSAAVEAYSRVLELAPDTDYANQASAALNKLDESGEIQLAGYQVREFNGQEHLKETPALEQLAEPAMTDRLKLRLDTGVLFNSNVALSPLSRSLAPGETDSAQFFLAPDIEYQLMEAGGWRSGPRAAGNFTWNESTFSNFNLQSYRPGWFFERDFFGETLVSSLRIVYEFAHDEFREQTFGNRHAVVTSGTLFWDDVQATTLYWSSDYTNFTNDGAAPSITSLDGWTNAVGLSQEWGLTSPFLSLVRIGGQVERADTTGSDTLYNGFSLNGELGIPIAAQTDGSLSGSWGIRDYPDFQSGIARDETIWSAAAEIRHRLTDHLLVRGVVTLDRFVSDNPLFDAERFTTGIVLIYER